MIVGTAELPSGSGGTLSGGTIAPDISVTPPATSYLGKGQCPDQSRSHDNLQKSVVITRFLRTSPQTANAGNLFAAESGVPELIHAQLSEQYQSIGPSVLQQGFAATNVNEAQLKQHAQKIAHQSRTQFVLSGTIHDMAMDTPETTYAPNLYRRTANAFHDISGIEKFDKRTRTLSMDVQPVSYTHLTLPTKA